MSASIEDLEARVNEIASMLTQAEGAKSASTLGRWAKSMGAAVVGIFVAGAAFSQIRQDVVVKGQFNPLVSRVENLERATSGMAPRLEKLENAMDSVTVGLQGLKTEVSGLGGKLGLLVDGQMARDKQYRHDRYCGQILGDYMKQLQEFTAKVRTVRPEYSSDLDTCRVGRPPEN